jgi:hypothetical protein
MGVSNVAATEQLEKNMFKVHLLTDKLRAGALKNNK